MEETNEQTKDRIVELRKQDPQKWTYAALKAETGIKQDSTITKILNQAGLARRRSSARPQSSAQGNESRSITPPTPATTPAPTAPVQPTAGDGVSDLQPPAYKAKAKPHPQQFNCSECRVPFVLDPGEKIEDVKACPSCGEAFE